MDFHVHHESGRMKYMMYDGVRDVVRAIKREPWYEVEDVEIYQHRSMGWYDFELIAWKEAGRRNLHWCKQQTA